jgi:hypothetical protein
MTEIDDIPPPRRMRRERRGAVRQLLEEQVRKSTRPWWRRSWQGVVVGTGTTALVLAGGVATAYVAFKPAEDQTSVLCYARADLDADPVDVTRLAVARDTRAGDDEADSGTVPVEDPVSACAQAWRDGLLPSHGDRAARPGAAGQSPVPDLVACTLDEGVSAVFPGDPATCERLGLPRTLTR